MKTINMEAFFIDIFNKVNSENEFDKAKRVYRSNPLLRDNTYSEFLERKEVFKELFTKD